MVVISFKTKTGCTLLGNYKLISLKRVNSTQTRAHEMIASGNATDGMIIMADVQTAGHGRHSRKWVSNSGNLYVSFIFSSLRRDPRLAYVVAVAVKDVLNSFGIHAGIKWPNDILIDGAKVCGILIEYIDQWVVVGIGINIQSCPDIAKYQTTYLGRYVNVTRAALMGRLTQALDKWRGCDFDTVRDAWMASAVGIGKKIMYHDIPSVICGIDGDGALILDQSGSRVRIYGDEISY